MYHDEEFGDILNSLYLVAITFLCVGYGDIVANTYCGRGICLICGIMVRLKANVSQEKFSLMPCLRTFSNVLF